MARVVVTLPAPDFSSTMHQAVLLLGSNLGNREEHLWNAQHRLENEQVRIILRSSVYATEPWGVTGQPEYLNLAVWVYTTLSPHELLIHCKNIEVSEGRTDPRKYLSRTLDIDILFYDEAIVISETLVIPHPRLHLRKFALSPLCEMAPDLNHPVLDKTMLELLEECPDTCRVKKWSEPE